MPLNISLQRLTTEFDPKAYPIAPPKEASSSSGANAQPIDSDVHVDLSRLEIIKIIPEENTYGGRTFSLSRSWINSNDNFITNTKSDKLVEEIAPETGAKVREESGSNR